MGAEEVAGRGQVRLDAEDYRALRRACETYREELILRFGAEVGLRPAEMTRVRPSDVRPTEFGDSRQYLLTVSEGEDQQRLAYLPPEVEHEMRKFARAEDVADDEPYLPVTPRRVQMLVSEITGRAAERTGRTELSEASSRTLRQHFARRLLTEEWVDPRVVKTIGGWERIESLAPYLDEPGPGEIVAAFAQPGQNRGPPRETAAATDEGDAGLSALVDAVSAVGTALEDVSTKEAMFTCVCERLAEVFAGVWVGERTGDGFEVVAGDGLDGTGAEAATATATDRARDGTLVATESVQADDDFDGWAGLAGDGAAAGAVVPVGDGEQTHGVLGILDDRAGWGEDERALLAELGRRVGYAVTVARQRKFLLADTVVELTFACRSDDSFFAAAAGHHDCALALDGVVPGDEGALVYFVTLTGADASAVVEWATERPAVVDARLVRDYGDEALLELVVDGQDLSRLLVERGATLQEMHAEEGRQELVVGVPAESDVRTLVDDVTAAVAGTELLTKRERGRTAESRPAFRSSLREELTDKQAAVLQAAYHAGYFEWPRGSTAEELADAIGITSPTLHNHLRRAQQKLLTAFFQEDHPAAETTPWNGE